MNFCDIKILDCTLRDGGYYTNWDFGKDLIEKYFENIDNLPIDFIEVGYRSSLKDKYLGEYFYLPLTTIQSIKKYTSKKIAIMINAKEFHDIFLQELLIDVKPYVSLIRIATDPKEIEFSIKLAKQIKSLGFDVALNVMYVSKIETNHSLFDFLGDINECVDILNLVDSYGSIYPGKLKDLITKVQTKTNIPLGYHGHNNLELAFINAIQALECGVKYIDSTILGMGRGAGNLKTELFLIYLHSKQNINLDLNALGELTELFLPLQTKHKWGTNLAYMVSGIYSLPQKDVMEALELDRYSLSGIVNQIKNDATNKLPTYKDNKTFENCLIIGGGKSVLYHFKAIKEFINKTDNLLVFHASSKYLYHFKDIDVFQYFAVAGDELLKVNTNNKIDKYIMEPSPRKINSNYGNISNAYELEKFSIIGLYQDSPLAITLQAIWDTRIPNNYLVGFDGYSELKSSKELFLMQENQAIFDIIMEKIKLVFITPTKYKRLTEDSVYRMLL